MISHPSRSRRRTAVRAARWLGGLGLCFGVCLGATQAMGQATREYDLKAVFLFNFTQFAEWPAAAFVSPDEPFVIGVLGDDPFGPVLDEVVRGEQANGRPLKVRRFRFSDEVDRCHLLFIGRSHRGRHDREIAAWHERHILTVADGGEGWDAGGVAVEFLTAGNRIRLRIDTGAVEMADVNISSKLLRLAELVGGNR